MLSNVYEQFLSSFTVALLRKTKLVSGGRNLKIFKRNGDANQAERDFLSLKPSNVKDFGVSCLLSDSSPYTVHGL